MKKLTYIWIVLSCLFLKQQISTAQNMEQLVDLQYNQEMLAVVLDDIHHNYDVDFVYSRNYIPLSEKVNVMVIQTPLVEALTVLFKELPIVFKEMGGKIALKIDEEKKALLEAQRLSMQLPPLILSPRERAITPQIPTKTKDKILLKGAGGDHIEVFEYNYVLGGKPKKEKKGLSTRITLFPSTTEKVGEKNFSLNLFWGNNESINGLELGGVVNQVREDVKGVQLGGVGNVVGGDLEGSQTTLGANLVLGCVHGVQVAGVSNIAGGKVYGVQFSGLFNYTETADKNVQITGGANYSLGETAFQLGTVNYAENITTGQIGWLVNKAKKVDGFQIGLINISDTITKTPIGLLSYVKKGYNRLQVGGSDVLYLQLSSKFGVKKFYNIFEIGGRWDNVVLPTINGEAQGEGLYMSWALGYGVGRAITVGKNSLINIELVSMHLNEAKIWTKRLNLLNQLRTTFDYSTNGRVSFYMGPIVYVHVANTAQGAPLIEQPSLMAPLVDIQKRNTKTTAWVGFHAGMRF